MTATEVNGLKVVEDEPTRTGITSKDGQAVYQHQTRTLLLEDGTIVYGCVHCDYTSEKLGAVRPHLNKHRPADARRTAQRTPVAPGLTVSQLLDSAAELEKLAADRDRWKARAVKAERELATVRRVLNGAR